MSMVGFLARYKASAKKRLVATDFVHRGREVKACSCKRARAMNTGISMSSKGHGWLCERSTIMLRLI
jgi:hypothetical protein